MKEHYSASATALALHASLAAWHASDASRPQSIVNLGSASSRSSRIRELVARYQEVKNPFPRCSLIVDGLSIQVAPSVAVVLFRNQMHVAGKAPHTSGSQTRGLQES